MELNQESARSKMQLEAIAKRNGGSVISHVEEDGVVRLKIVVRKVDLNQMLDVIRGGKNNAHDQPSNMISLSTAEHRQKSWLKRHQFRTNAAKRSGQSSWSPALQSIPEER
ncbi:hypothetical protein FCV25MIE_00616 [Fagus crenata]